MLQFIGIMAMGRIFWKMDRSMLLYGCFLILLCFELTEIVLAQRLYDVRLVGGSNPEEGRVEIYYQSSWGTVCDDSWGAEESQVVCRQLGYSGSVETHARAAFGEGTGSIWLDDVSCTGTERSLSLCSHRDWGSNDCSHSEDVGVRCNTGSGSSGSIRLSGGTAENEGRVEVYHNGQWGTVCDDNWDTTDGDVACRQLGFPGVDAVINVDSGLGPIWLDNLECGGTEQSLSSCTHNGWGINDCSHAEDAGVRCLPKVESDGSLRLVGGGTENEGRLEILHKSEWGTVCNSGWDVSDGTVACRQLGYPGIDMVGIVVGGGSGAIWLSDIQCSGAETALTDCPHSGWGVHSCDHKNDVKIRCTSTNEPDRSVRLADGTTESEGRVEIFHNGQWGTVCDDGWDRVDGGVVCRQLGYVGVDLVYSSAYFARGSGSIWLDDVECSGSEQTLAECSSGGWGIHNCGHSEDASVSCIVDALQDGSVRLVDGTTESEGRVEIYYNGEWGTICDDSWDRSDGAVVCQQLGYAGVDSIFDSAYFGRGSGSILLDDVECSGSEQTLAECSSGGWGIHDCGHGEDAGVSCILDVLQDGSVRLVDGTTESEGRVEIFYNGEWGTICDDSWDRSDGAVVCRQLGYASVDSVYDSAYFGGGSGSIILDDVECSGSEQTLAECSSGGWGMHNCGHDEDAGVRCSFKAGSSLSGGAIAGIVIGSLVGICLFYCCCLRRKKKSQPPTVYNAVPVDQSRTEEQQELGAVTGAVDANNTPLPPPVIPAEPYDTSVPDLPPPSYDEIGKYSFAGMPGAEMAYPPSAAAGSPYPTAASSTPYPPAAPSEVPYPPPSTNASVTYNYPSADSGVVPSAPPADTPS